MSLLAACGTKIAAGTSEEVCKNPAVLEALMT